MDFEILKAQWEDLEDWKKLIIILVLSGILAYAVYFFILSSKIEEKNRLEAELQQKNNEFEVIKRNASPEKRAKLIQDLEKEKLETERLKQQLEEVKAKFKPNDDLKRTINFITNIASKNGVILENINIVSVDDVFLKYNPTTDKVETIVMNTSDTTNNKIAKIKNRLAPRKHQRNNNNSKEGKTEQTNNNEDTRNMVHLKRYRYDVSIKGTTRSVVNLIKDIVNTKNFVNVEKVNLTKSKKGKGLVETNLELVSYTEANNSIPSQQNSQNTSGGKK